MARIPRPCPECRKKVIPENNECPRCGTRMYKTFGEAYSWGGLGVFDLIPGVRDLPYAVRFTFMVVTITVILVLVFVLWKH